ncbi:J domain-containing protein [Tundrisphaera sp. TA3]|uniref:J domain-containing protein n=1 Tax=Tundrisphaera sp. TA3 TaxID=3435775 RepID=UPI003EBFC1B9
MTEAYPLQWPAGKPRKQHPERSKFGDRSIDAATTILREELRRLGAGNMVLSSNLRLKNDGLPYSKQAQPRDQGVAVYFTHKKQPMCFACDRWDRIQDNNYAIAMTIEALRGIERWGSGSMVEQAFTGFIGPPGAERPACDPRCAARRHGGGD